MSKNKQRQVSAFSQGRFDMRNGAEKRIDNPFSKKSPLHFFWKSGWRFEEREVEKGLSVMAKVKRFFRIKKSGGRK